jgi:carbon monoxide dehydrogenase subunit G
VRPFTFVRTFTIPAPVDRVQAVLVDLEWYSSWWSEIVAVAKLSDDDALVVCKSALPYELELHLTAVHREPECLEVAIDGDLIGFARFELAAVDNGTRLEFTEEVEVAGRALRFAAYVGRPLLVWNHDRMLESCIRGMTRRVQESMWDMSP